MNLVKKRKQKRQYKNLSEEKKDKRCEYACEKYRNLSEEEKDRDYAREQYGNLSKQL